MGSSTPHRGNGVRLAGDRILETANGQSSIRTVSVQLFGRVVRCSDTLRTLGNLTRTPSLRTQQTTHKQPYSGPFYISNFFLRPLLFTDYIRDMAEAPKPVTFSDEATKELGSPDFGHLILVFSTATNKICFSKKEAKNDEHTAGDRAELFLAFVKTIDGI